jgi:hypothetical protein
VAKRIGAIIIRPFGLVNDRAGPDSATRIGVQAAQLARSSTGGDRIDQKLEIVRRGSPRGDSIPQPGIG